MNLSQDIIYYQLQKKFSLRYLKKSSQNSSYSRPVFWEPAIEDSNLTLLVDSKDFNDQLPAKSLFILTQPPLFDLTHIDATILLIDTKLSMHTLFNTLQKIFNLFDHWDAHLQKSVFENGNYQDQINSCEQVLDEWIMLVDHKFHYAAFSKACEELFDDTVIDEHYNMPIDAVNDFISDQKFQALYDERDIFLYEAITPDGTDQMLCRNFFNQNTYAGRLIIMLVTGRDEFLKAYIRSILEHLYYYSNLLFEKYQSLDIKYIVLNNMREPLINLLNDLQNPIGQWERIALENGWKKADSLQLLQFSSKASYTMNIYSEFLGFEIESQWPGCISLFFDEKLLLLINLNLYKQSCKNDFYQQLPLFLRESLLIAGLSRIFDDINGLKTAYQQTKIALETGKIHASTAWIHYFDDFAYYQMLKNCTGHFNDQQICNPKLLELKAYDDRKHTEYYQTLSIYFQCRLNASLTAKTLHIHRSSLLTRLERMKKLFDIDLESNHELLYLLLSWQVLEENQ
ncbi:helix-turn-helix domain-containing protein [Eubacteriaceae bacterium ES3]|nr:helix-turn-helix domain-containing protein [Eubacteriaceae bacterium ES3]